MGRGRAVAGGVCGKDRASSGPFTRNGARALKSEPRRGRTGRARGPGRRRRHRGSGAALGRGCPACPREWDQWLGARSGKVPNTTTHSSLWSLAGVCVCVCRGACVCVGVCVSGGGCSRALRRGGQAGVLGAHPVGRLHHPQQGRTVPWKPPALERFIPGTEGFGPSSGSSVAPFPSSASADATCMGCPRPGLWGWRCTSPQATSFLRLGPCGTSRTEVGHCPVSDARVPTYEDACVCTLAMVSSVCHPVLETPGRETHPPGPMLGL